MNTINRVPRGSAMVIGFIMVLMLLAFAIVFATRLSSNALRMESDSAGERSYELAQTANTLKIMQIWNDFKAQPVKQRVAWLGGEDLNHNGLLDKGEDVIPNSVLDPEQASHYQDSEWVPNTTGAVCTRVKALSEVKDKWVLVRFTTWAKIPDEISRHDVIRKVQRVVKFELRQASVFDFVYFATNYGSLDGKLMTLHGPVGSNSDLSLLNNPMITGRLFAAQNADTGAVGQVTGSAGKMSLDQYKLLMLTNSLLRPTNPVAMPEDKNNNGFLDFGEDSNGNGRLDSFNYDQGYDGTQTVQNHQSPAVMPQLEDLETYKGYAASYTRPSRPDLGETSGKTGSIIKQLSAPGLDPTDPANYTILINQTYGDHGEAGLKANVNGFTGAVTYGSFKNKIDADPTLGWKNGNVVLVGTAEQPLVVLGPVVVTNDIAIKGTVTGQGTLYAGRNIHPIGDILLKNPPAWKPDDIYFDQTAKANKAKDLVGFAARGNIVMGDYTGMDTGIDQWPAEKAFMKPPYTKPQKVENKDDHKIGYGDGKSPSGPKGKPAPPSPGSTFAGDYTVVDGDKFYLNDESVPLKPNRAYYQSTFPKAYINSIAVKPHILQGAFYAGHFFGGRANNLQLFGSLVTRDEGVLSDNGATFIYDVRISPSTPSTYVNLFLPHDAALTILYWKDSGLDDANPSSVDW